MSSVSLKKNHFRFCLLKGFGPLTLNHENKQNETEHRKKRRFYDIPASCYDYICKRACDVILAIAH